MIKNELIVKMNNNFKQFVDKLNSYIRKFYLYQLVRGLILFVLIALVYYILIATLEFFTFFEPRIKLLIVVFTVVVSSLNLIYFIIRPILKLLGIGKILSYYDVSKQLNKAYPEIKDKLVNIIELANESDSLSSISLKNASIDQKINELRLFRFTEIIRFKDLKFPFLFLFTVMLVFAVLFINKPALFSESSARLIHFQQKFEKPAPYSFKLLNKNLEIITGESVELNLQCLGNDIPETMYVNIGGNNFIMKREKEFFTYVVDNVNSSVSFYFTDKWYISDLYRITVINKPFISSFSVEINPPSYTNIQPETLMNIGDFKVAAGTRITWKFNAVDTDSLSIKFSDSTYVRGVLKDKYFEIGRKITKDLEYSVSLSNSKISENNKLTFNITTLNDLYPEIKVVQLQDSTDLKNFMFKGNIIDDYGFSKLDFNISFEGRDTVFKVPFTPFLLNQEFYYSFNFESLRDFGKTFKYFFSVSDNDYIHNYKRSLSETFTFSFPDYQDLALRENEDLNQMDQLMEKSMKLSEGISQDMLDLKMKQINDDLTEYEKFQAVKDIMSKKNELEETIRQINKQNEDANKFQNSFTEEKSDLLEKQKQIEDLLNEVFTDELKKLFEEFNNLAKQFDSKKFDQLSKDIDSNLDDLSKQLDKNMQLLKKMKVEQKVERILEELKKLKESENSISDGLEKNSDIKSITRKELDNSLIFNTLEKDYQDALEFNKELEKPMNLFDLEKEFKGIKNNYSEVIEDLKKGNRRKSLKLIENNMNSLDQLIFAMDKMLNSGKKKENEANEEDLKQILENLIMVSFNQEKILNQLKSTDYNSPEINHVKIKQRNMGLQVAFVKD